jgi:hypothetical protein
MIGHYLTKDTVMAHQFSYPVVREPRADTPQGSEVSARVVRPGMTQRELVEASLLGHPTRHDQRPSRFGPSR